MLTIPIYEQFSRLRSGNESHLDRFLQRVGISMLSGTLVSVLLYPLDTLKRISQLNGGRAALKLYKSDAEVASKAYKDFGARAMYRGVAPFAASQVIMSYAMFWFFDLYNIKVLGLK